MSGTFEEQLDLAMELRHQRRRQHEAEQAQSGQAIREAHAELERKQARFCKEVRSLIEKAVAKANRHLDILPVLGTLVAQRAIRLPMNCESMVGRWGRL